MTGIPTKARAAGAVAAGTILTGLVYLSVHPVPAVSRLGALPMAAALWGTFAAGAWLVRRTPGRWVLGLILAAGIAVQFAAVSAPPRGSDDLYRYIWDGKVQAAGIDPYRYPPAAFQLAHLRDPFLWPAHAQHCVAPGTPDPGQGGVMDPGCTRINRPLAHTIYPPVAEAYFLAVHVVSPSGGGSVPIQAAAAACAVAVTLLLLFGLGYLGRDQRLAVLWAWCPTVALETGNNAHVDVLAAGLALAALLVLARARQLRSSLAGGALLALAIWAKVTPVLVVPAAVKRRPFAVAAAALLTTVTVYLPHLLAVGGGVIGYMPGYLHEEGYGNGTRFSLISLLVPDSWALAVAFVALAAVAVAVLLRSDPDRPWQGAVVMTGLALAIATPPFPWYALLLVMLVALDGKAEWLAFAVVKYVAVRMLLPGLFVHVYQAEQAAYGTALALVAAVAVARWLRERRAVQDSAPLSIAAPDGAAAPAEPAGRVHPAGQAAGQADGLPPADAPVREREHAVAEAPVRAEEPVPAGQPVPVAMFAAGRTAGLTRAVQAVPAGSSPGPAPVTFRLREEMPPKRRAGGRPVT